LKTQLSQLVNIYRNEETLSYQPLANTYISNSIDLIQDSCYFENQDSISEHLIKLDQHQNIGNHNDIWTSYPFPKIELENECDHEPQHSNSIPLLDSILTPVSLPQFNSFFESKLDPVPIYFEIESPIFYDHHIELDQFYIFESPIDKLASSHYDIKLNEECDLDSQICDPV